MSVSATWVVPCTTGSAFGVEAFSPPDPEPEPLFELLSFFGFGVTGVGVAGGGRQSSPLARALPAPVNGTLRVPLGPGLGVDESALAEIVVDELPA